jgi:hypothetical protein
MFEYTFIAGCLVILLGVVHSVLGEILIFKKMRVSGLIPTNGGTILKERNVRILWASWHLVTLFGWAFAAMLFGTSFDEISVFPAFVINTVSLFTFLGAALVLIATKGKHPGWIVLLTISVLCWFS